MPCKNSLEKLLHSERFQRSVRLQKFNGAPKLRNPLTLDHKSPVMFVSCGVLKALGFRASVQTDPDMPLRAWTEECKIQGFGCPI